MMDGEHGVMLEVLGRHLSPIAEQRLRQLGARYPGLSVEVYRDVANWEARLPIHVAPPPPDGRATVLRLAGHPALPFVDAWDRVPVLTIDLPDTP